MNRRMVNFGALPSDLDINQNMQFAMVGMGFLAEAVVGVGAWACGLAASQTTVASMTVNIGRGTLGQMSVVDQTNPGTSAIADSTDALMKVGINLAATPLTFVAPTTSGQSQVFLIQGQMQEADVGPTVLQYWNSANPAVPLSGPGGSGASNNTLRTQVVALSVVAGAPAGTGSQATPAAATGWVPLYTITLNNGQTAITTAQIVQHPAAPFIDATLTGRGIQSGRLLNRRTVSQSQIYIPTLGTNVVFVQLSGGGASGASTQPTGSGQIAASPGGGGGGDAEKWITGGFAGALMTIGGGGAAPSASANGNPGGTTSFGTIFSATGGSAPNVGATGPANGLPVGGAAGGVGVGGDVNGRGGSALYALYTSPATSSAGGRSRFGAGGLGVTGSGNGTAATSPGAGGGGGAQSVGSAGAAIGGAGANGTIIIWEFS